MCDSDPDQKSEAKDGDPKPDIPIKTVMSIPDDTADHSNQDEREDK